MPQADNVLDCLRSLMQAMRKADIVFQDDVLDQPLKNFIVANERIRFAFTPLPGEVSEYRSLRCNLKDVAWDARTPPQKPTVVGLTVVVDQARSLLVIPDGYGVHTHDGAQPVATVEVWEKSLRLIVWADINQEDPTHVINLEGARLSARKPEEGAS